MSRSESTPFELDIDDQETIELVSDSVSYCLNREEVLRDVCMDLYRRHIDGEKIQQEMNTLFREHREFYWLATVGYTSDMEDILIKASDQNEISEAELADFIDLWNEISWVGEPALASYLIDEQNEDYWTSKTADFEVRANAETVVKPEMKQGVDEIYSMTVPIDMFLYDSAARIERVVNWLNNEEFDAQPKLNEDSFDNIEEAKEIMVDALEDWDDSMSKIESLE